MSAPGRLNVGLVNMPWARVDAPSIQCGLLASIAKRAGHDCDVHYFNVEFAAMLGRRTYDSISEMHAGRLHLLGEWLFAYSAFGDVTPAAEYFREFPELEGIWLELTGQDTSSLIDLRRTVVPAWLQEQVDSVDWAAYDVVGFTSTFLQNSGALALGRLLRKKFPELCLIYGGANFDGHMGPVYAEHIPWLDYVVSGEADTSFPALLDAVATGAPVTIPGVYGRNANGGSSDIVPITRRLDDLPVPDYHDYFRVLSKYDRTEILGGEPAKLPVEFSRGCWWGEKHHCTFCGLNALGMAFRSKSGGNAIGELSTLLSEYPVVHVDAVDNILDMKYFSSFCADLAALHWDVNIFFEVKANLSKEQLAVLARAGILRIQPGIESLSTHVLGLMRKGATKLINIRLLKWAAYYGITVLWNMLMGFPGESDSDYYEQAELLPSLWHLRPPSGCGEIWLERFSPYFTDPSFPIDRIEPRSCYRHVYPEYLDHAEIAYFFDYKASDVSSRTARSALEKAVGEWKDRWEDGSAPSLIYQRIPNRVTLIDRRTSEAKRAVLEGWMADAYLTCDDTPRSLAGVAKDLAAKGRNVSSGDLRSFLTRCCNSRVMVEDAGKYLSLAIPENPGL